MNNNKRKPSFLSEFKKRAKEKLEKYNEELKKKTKIDNYFNCSIIPTASVNLEISELPINNEQAKDNSLMELGEISDKQNEEPIPQPHEISTISAVDILNSKDPKYWQANNHW